MSLLTAIVGYESGCGKNKIRQNSTLRHNLLNYPLQIVAHIFRPTKNCGASATIWGTSSGKQAAGGSALWSPRRPADFFRFFARE